MAGAAGAPGGGTAQEPRRADPLVWSEVLLPRGLLLRSETVAQDSDFLGLSLCHGSSAQPVAGGGGELRWAREPREALSHVWAQTRGRRQPGLRGLFYKSQAGWWRRPECEGCELEVTRVRAHDPCSSLCLRHRVEASRAGHSTASSFVQNLDPGPISGQPGTCWPGPAGGQCWGRGEPQGDILHPGGPGLRCFLCDVG